MQLFVSESCMTKQSDNEHAELDNEHAEDVSAHIYQSVPSVVPSIFLSMGSFIPAIF